MDLPERIQYLGFGLTFLQSQPTNSVSLLHWEAPPRAGGIPIHVHEHTEEGFYVLRAPVTDVRTSTIGFGRPGCPETSHQRRAWDSNPRWVCPIAVFKTAAIGH